MRTARWAAFLALSMPTHATGTPPGTWAVASSASRPFKAPTANGTPITGRSVSDAAKPGSAADSPAPAMITLNPWPLAPDTSFVVCSGWRWAEETWNSYVTPACVRMSKAGSIRGLSFSEPTRISTSATSGRLVDEAVVLAALAGRVPRVRDQAPHLGQRHAPRGARGGDDVLLHHQGAEVVGSEPQRHLTDLRAHRHPRRLDVGNVVEHDARDRLGAQVGDGVGLAEVLELGVLRLQRPADERGEPAGPGLHLPHPEQVLDAIGERLAQAVHHGHRRPESPSVGRLHHLEPAVGTRLLAGDAVAHLLHQDLPAAAGNGVQPCRDELADHLIDGHPEATREEIDLRGREPVDVDGVVLLDVAQQVQIPRERDIGVVPNLDQDLHAAERFELVDLAADLLEREHVALGVLGSPVERAKLAVGDAHVRVIDVPVDDVADHVLRVQPPARLVRERTELEQRGAVVQLDEAAELARRPIERHQATSR